jgi:hypothetical protein
MSAAICVYDLTIGVEATLDAFTQIAHHLGLSAERVLINAQGHKWLRRMPIGRSDSIDSFFSELNDFGFTATPGDDIDAVNAAMLLNCASYVSYTRAANRDSLTVFSQQLGEQRDFCERFIRGVPAKYGFGMDWNKPGSFFGYSHGFDDFNSVGGNLLGESDAGRWGVQYLQSDPFFDKGYFRDIYPVNLLTVAHLNRETGDGAVRDLILGNKDWGEVTPLADDWFMWWVPLDEIEKVRSDFKSRRLLGTI